MPSRKSSVNIVELKKELAREKTVIRALTALLIDKRIFTREELEAMLEKIAGEEEMNGDLACSGDDSFMNKPLPE